MKSTTPLTLHTLNAICKMVIVSYNRCSINVAINIIASVFTDILIMSEKSGYDLDY